MRTVGNAAVGALTRCPACAGKLIYARDLAGFGGETIASRRCPEYEHRDLVVTARLPALLWFDRIVCERSELLALCGALADGLRVEGDLARNDVGRPS